MGASERECQAVEHKAAEEAAPSAPRPFSWAEEAEVVARWRLDLFDDRRRNRLLDDFHGLTRKAGDQRVNDQCVHQNDEYDADHMSGRISLLPCVIHCGLTPVAWRNACRLLDELFASHDADLGETEPLRGSHHASHNGVLGRLVGTKMHFRLNSFPSISVDPTNGHVAGVWADDEGSGSCGTGGSRPSLKRLGPASAGPGQRFCCK